MEREEGDEGKNDRKETGKVSKEDGVNENADEGKIEEGRLGREEGA